LGKQYKELTNIDINFISKQKLFYIASCSDSEVNLSPRGYNSLKVINSTTLHMIDFLGSGNRTARDISEDGEITILFNAFEDAPKILRCFCKGATVLKEDSKFKDLVSAFNEDISAIRQVFIFNIYAVETSCGMGVPVMEFKQERPEVRNFALKMAKQNKFDEYVKDHETPPNLKGL